MKYSLFIIVLLIGAASCGGGKIESIPSKGEDYAKLGLPMEDMAELEQPVAVGYSDEADIVQSTTQRSNVDQKLIKTAYLTMKVEDMESSFRQFKEMIDKYGGFVSNDNYRNFPDRKSRSMTIRVDAENLEVLLGEMAESGGYVENRSISITDVTEEFVDIGIRLENKRAVRDQYIRLLERASRVEDILKIENELRVIREEIEAKEGRLRYLKDQVALSTIHLEMNEEIILAQKPPTKSFFVKAYESIEAGWVLMVNIFLFLIRIWPVLIILAAVIVILRKSLKKRRSHVTAG